MGEREIFNFGKLNIASKVVLFPEELKHYYNRPITVRAYVKLMELGLHYVSPKT